MSKPKKAKKPKKTEKEILTEKYLAAGHTLRPNEEVVGFDKMTGMFQIRTIENYNIDKFQADCDKAREEREKEERRRDNDCI